MKRLIRIATREYVPRIQPVGFLLPNNWRRDNIKSVGLRNSRRHVSRWLLSQRVREGRHRRDILRQLLRIDFVERIRRRMMKIEVMKGIGNQSEARHPSFDQEGSVGTRLRRRLESIRIQSR